MLQGQILSCSVHVFQTVCKLSEWTKRSHQLFLCLVRICWRQMNQEMKTSEPLKLLGPFPGLPLCSLGIMKDAWDRLRQCISPTTSMPHGGNNTLPILNQAFQFVCGGLVHASPSSPTLPGGQTCGQADPKAITFAIMQQQQRAEVVSSLVFLPVFFF